mmetsp:Transcript_19837/g.64073  ORF Transcript_19837/g.64073 Transcript_19837/m.64073 type:complete len:614 (-) Transcript_19837:223-2064(-)
MDVLRVVACTGHEQQPRPQQKKTEASACPGVPRKQPKAPGAEQRHPSHGSVEGGRSGRGNAHPGFGSAKAEATATSAHVCGKSASSGMPEETRASGDPGVAANAEPRKNEQAADRRTSTGGCGEGQSVHSLLAELLDMPRDEVTARLKNLPEATLRDLVAELLALMESDSTGGNSAAEAQSCQAEASAALPGDGGQAPERGCGEETNSENSSSEDERMHATLAICDAELDALCDAQCDDGLHDSSVDIDTFGDAAGGDDDEDDDELQEEASGVDAKSTRECAHTRGSKVRGVYKRNRNSDFFQSEVGFENMLLQTRSPRTLDAAIDMHISLVQLKQMVRASLLEGVDFRSALTRAVAIVLQERNMSDAPKMQLYYRVQCPWLQGKRVWQTKDFQEAIVLWEKFAASRSQRRVQFRLQALATLKRKEAAKQARAEAKDKYVFEQAAARAAAQQSRAERLEDREAKKRRCEEQREERMAWKQATKRQRHSEKRRQASARARQGLLDRLMATLREAERPRKKLLKQNWKVAELPEGLEFASFRSEGDCVCALLALASGVCRRGPLRRSIVEAWRDCKDFEALQKSSGDAAAVEELETRDVLAMTAFFAADIRGRCC